MPFLFLHRIVVVVVVDDDDDGEDVKGESAAVMASVGDRQNLQAGDQSDKGVRKRVV